MENNTKNLKKQAQSIFCITVGNALLAFLVAAFIIPHDIIMGGTTGIGIVLGKLTSLDTAIFVLVLNVLLLMIGLLVLGKKFFITTVASSLLYPVFLGFMQRIPGIDSLTDDPTLAALFAGVLMGIALGLVMRVGSSTGGMDIVCLILSKLLHKPVAIFVYITDFIVVGGQAIFSKPEKILLGLLVLALESIVLERVMLLGKSQIQLFIVSDKYEEIRKRFLEELEAGVTLTEIETGRLSKHQKGIICVIPPRKLYYANRIAQETDPSAFITISQINEVHGRGFTEERRNIDPPAQ